MTAVHPEASQQAVVEAALVLLERMGLTAADLAAAPPPGKQVPTFAEYVPVVSAAEPAGRTGRTGTGSSSTGAPAGWTSRPRRRSGS
jgi:integrase/recombinase XerC